MPAFNGRRYLEQALDSMLAQSYADWELLFIDDGSTDDSAQIAKAYSDPRIRYFHQRNPGQAAALNHGLDVARGELITTLDVDDWYTADSLSARVEKLRGDPSIGAVYGDGVFCTAAGEEIKRFRSLIPHEYEGDIFPSLISNPFFGTGANVLVRRAVLEEHGIRYDPSLVWCQDYDFYLRIAEVCRFGRVSIPTVWYRQHDANMTATMPSERRIESLFRTKFRVLESGRFPGISLQDRCTFFYELVRNDLYTRIPYQIRIFGHPRFLDLPSEEQARLLRLVGVGYLSNGCLPEFAADCIQRARRTNRNDLKSQILAILLKLDPRLARRAVRLWSTPSVGHA
jgi:glycosyltransferase involved in cell wall biosynthesis